MKRYRTHLEKFKNVVKKLIVSKYILCNNQKITRRSHSKVNGVLIDSKFSFVPHKEHTNNKSFKLLRVILETLMIFPNMLNIK